MECPRCQSEDVTSLATIELMWTCMRCTLRWIPVIEGDDYIPSMTATEGAALFNEWMEK